MWDREHIPHALEARQPRRSIHGPKRGRQCNRTTLQDVDTTITSPKSINSIPEDYITFLFIKCSLLEAALLDPFIFSHLRWFPHPQQWDENPADASKSQRGSRGSVWQCLGVTVKQPYRRQDRNNQELACLLLSQFRIIWTQTPETFRWTQLYGADMTTVGSGQTLSRQQLSSCK